MRNQFKSLDDVMHKPSSRMLGLVVRLNVIWKLGTLRHIKSS